jgi:hypothetical protein
VSDGEDAGTETQRPMTRTGAGQEGTAHLSTDHSTPLDSLEPVLASALAPASTSAADAPADVDSNLDEFFAALPGSAPTPMDADSSPVMDWQVAWDLFMPPGNYEPEGLGLGLGLGLELGPGLPGLQGGTGAVDPGVFSSVTEAWALPDLPRETHTITTGGLGPLGAGATGSSASISMSSATLDAGNHRLIQHYLEVRLTAPPTHLTHLPICIGLLVNRSNANRDAGATQSTDPWNR